MTTAAEISYAKQFGTKLEFSPVQLAYFLYNRVTDPLGYTAGDKNILVGSGRGVNYASAGGNVNFAAHSLATWAGYANESVAPFATYVKSDGTGTAVSSSKAYKDSALLKTVEKPDTPSTLKKAIKQNGSVVVSIYWDASLFNYYNCYYYSKGKSTTTNHAVTLIGWNDNCIKNSDGTYSGAWIVQNSWGDDWGDDGYFYISYDELMKNPVSVVVQKADAYAYNYQYDGSVSLSGLNVTSGQAFGNVYTVKASGTNEYQKLDAVGFASGEGTFDLAVYTDITGSNPRSGKLATKVEGVKVSEEGFNTVSLPKSIYVKNGSKFSVVVTAKSNALINLDTTADYSWVRTVSETASKQSYYYSGSSWQDLNKYSYSARIKAYANEGLNISIPYTSYKYKGSAITPEVTITTSDGKTLQKTTDYTVSYSSNVNPGTAYAVVSLKGEYAGTARVPFKIVCKATNFRQVAATTNSIKLAWTETKCSGYKIYRYNSGSYKLIKTISGSGTTTFTNSSLSTGKIYKYKIRPYVKSGTSTISGTLSTEIATTTRPAKVSQYSPSTGSTHYVKFTWKTTSCSGYQVLYATNSSFKNAETYTTSASYAGVKLSGCTKGKTYYAKVRAYRTCNGKKYYGAYSYVKSIKCK